MILDEYIAIANKIIFHYEKQEDYEECAYYRDLIKSIKEQDEVTFVKLAFDLKGLKKCGLIKSLDPVEAIKKINHFFSFKSIFEYAQYDLTAIHFSHTPDYLEK